MKKFLVLILGLSYGVAMADSFDRSPSNPSAQISPPHQMTLADRKLDGILNSQNALLSELQNYPERFTDNERDRRFSEIFREYETFISENPKNIYAHIFYGKLLRMCGLTEDANKVFLAANKKDPGVAVIKQQIGNYLAELGDYGLALPYFLSAIELEPKVAIYYYQLGELLSTFKESFLSSRILTPEQFDQQILYAFDQARQLEPKAWIYQIRYVEAFYDLEVPRWEEALALWRGLKAAAPTVQEKEMVLLNEARVLIKLRRYEEAKECLATIFCPEFEKSRRELMELIPNFEQKVFN